MGGHSKYNEPKGKVPIPEGASVYKDGRVIIYLKRGREGRKRVVVGHANGEYDKNGRLLMEPNKKYEDYCKNDCAKARTGENGTVRALPPDVIHVGLYALVLGIVYQLGIYQILIDVYNAQVANGIIDLAMYYILLRHNDINVMAADMNEQLLFSIQPYSDTWFGDLFKHKDEPTSLDDANNKEFLIRWVRHVKTDLFEKEGLDFKSAALSLDGTNWKNQSKTIEEAAVGVAKTGEKTKIVGGMFCVIANGKYKGMPLAYCSTKGSDPDAKTSEEMISFFHGFDLYPEAILADRAFCTEDFMAGCDRLYIPFLLMMKENYTGAQTMYKLYGDLLRWNYDYRIRGQGLTFGLSEDGHNVFGPTSKNPDRTANLGEFFSASTAFSNINKFIKSLDKYIKETAQKIEEFENQRRRQAQTSNLDNATKVTTDIASKNELINRALNELYGAGIEISKKYQEYLTIEYNLDTDKYEIIENSEAVRKTCDSYGYYCLVSSSALTAQEMSDKYKLRDTSDKVFSDAKSSAGFGAFGIEGTPSFHGKLFSCFIAIIIRNRIEYECRHYKGEKVLDTNVFIAELNSITYKRSGGDYQYTGQTSAVQIDILSRFGISEEMLKQLGDLVNAHDNGMLINEYSHTARTIPGAEIYSQDEQPDTSVAADLNEPSSQPKRRGHPLGVKNKATLEKQAKLDEENERRAKAGLPPLNPHPGRGRIPGSKNKKTLQLEADLVKENKRRAKAGLPLFDLKQYKKYLKKLAQSTDQAPTNEIKQNTKALPHSPADKPKRGGRISGSINKKTLEQEEYDRQLSLETGIDIIGDNPPPRPWNNATRYAENKRRAKLRKEAEEIKKRNSIS